MFMNFFRIIIPSLILTVSAAAQQPVYTLDQIVGKAVENNVAISKARKNIAAAELQLKEARTNFFPSVSGNLMWFRANNGLAKMKIDLSGYITPEIAAALSSILPAEALTALSHPLSFSLIEDGTIAGINAVQPVFAGGRIVNGNRLAKVGHDASLLQLELSENEVTKTAEEYFWQIVTLEEKIKTLDDADRLVADIHKDVKVAVEAGVGMNNDLLQVQLRQNELQSQRLQLMNGISLCRMLLAQYCHLDSAQFRLAYSLDVESPLTAKKNHQSALASIPEYKLLNKQVEAAELQRKIEIGKNMPTVAVGVGYSFQNLLDENHTSPLVFATVRVPISDWWGGSSAIKRKQIEKDLAMEQLIDNSEMLTIRMQKAWNDVEEAYMQIDIARRSVEQAKENLRIRRDFYNAGASSMSDLLEAQLLYQQARNKHIDAVAAYQNRLLAYRQATGS